jgi:hypothetical protein
VTGGLREDGQDAEVERVIGQEERERHAEQAGDHGEPRAERLRHRGHDAIGHRGDHPCAAEHADQHGSREHHRHDRDDRGRVRLDTVELVLLRREVDHQRDRRRADEYQGQRQDVQPQ